ncbi:TPA: TnsA endonuclease N-terminal domain-containing protein [Pseudomonas aeruginosa]|nr:hypothetical protein [Pseudomonas aeruginosa]HCJ6265378.1 hypothetical protein [Pseudomonas aeruginosa]
MKTDNRSASVARDVARRTNRGRKAFVMCSPKNQRIEVRLESRLEQQIAQALELDPRVSAYRAQPFTLDLSTGERLLRKPKRKPSGAIYYTPDFALEIPGMEVAMEVKPSQYLAAHADLHDEVRRCLLTQGIRFVTVSEQTLPPCYQRNLQVLQPYLKQPEAALQSWASAILTREPEQLCGPVRSALQGLTPLSYFAMAGVLLGILKTNLQQHLLEGLDFEVSPAHGSLAAFEVIDFARQ